MQQPRQPRMLGARGGRPTHTDHSERSKKQQRDLKMMQKQHRTQTQLLQSVTQSCLELLFSEELLFFCNKSSIPVSEAISPVLLAQPCKGDVQRHCADQGVILDLLAGGQCRNLLLLVQVGHREVLAVSLQTTNTCCLALHLHVVLVHRVRQAIPCATHHCCM